jgi:hypothetical protein
LASLSKDSVVFLLLSFFSVLSTVFSLFVSGLSFVTHFVVSHFSIFSFFTSSTLLGFSVFVSVLLVISHLSSFNQNVSFRLDFVFSKALFILSLMVLQLLAISTSFFVRVVFVGTTTGTIAAAAAAFHLLS